MNPFSLAHKTILVTGASSGIGAEVAKCISKSGARVFATARNEERLKETLDSLEGSGHDYALADLTKEEDIIALIDKIDSLDGIVHSSGIVGPFPIKFIGKKHIDEMFDINYYGPVLLTSKLFRAKKINPSASLVFMSSVSTTFLYKGGALYSGSKAAINSYSKTIALEFAPQKIRSNVISAAMVRTPLFDEAEKSVSKEMMEKHRGDYPLGFGDPEDIANATLFLLSEGSRWITGTEIVMDGGLTAGH